MVVAVIIGAHKGWTCPSPGGFGSRPRRGEQCELLLLLPALPLLVRARALPLSWGPVRPASSYLTSISLPCINPWPPLLSCECAPSLTSATGGLVDEVR